MIGRRSFGFGGSGNTSRAAIAACGEAMRAPSRTTSARSVHGNRNADHKGSGQMKGHFAKLLTNATDDVAMQRFAHALVRADLANVDLIAKRLRVAGTARAEDGTAATVRRATPSLSASSTISATNRGMPSVR
jgi:hypothetical protein